MQIGAQLYTVREYCKTLEDFSKTLQKIAGIGYKTVQISGTCAYRPEWLREELSKNGLSCVITHTPPDRIAAHPDEVAAEHAVFGCRIIGIGHYDLDAVGPEEFYETFHPAALALARRGFRLSYHNHDGEFKRDGDIIRLERLARLFSPRELAFTLDTYWVQAGGGDPVWWIRHLAGRTPCIHLKDMAYGGKMAPIGEGNMNFPDILEACVRSGVEYALVEQDDCYGEDPFDCLAQSFRYLKKFALDA